ncbi:hypothetical protein C5E44_08290 [Nocardia nova]|uniref:hypothetical protein n=1 Tax=Nocardia nova TaxID=37330 RepID=UPI000CEA2621|nr:hypothetical protein C5E44_08290 [Nocardia nova]
MSPGPHGLAGDDPLHQFNQFPIPPARLVRAAARLGECAADDPKVAPQVAGGERLVEVGHYRGQSFEPARLGFAEGIAVVDHSAAVRVHALQSPGDNGMLVPCAQRGNHDIAKSLLVEGADAAPYTHCHSRRCWIVDAIIGRPRGR